MNKTTLLAAALICSSALAGDKAPKKDAKQAPAQVRCSGVNECKGKGECGGATTSCAGTNECKGKGWVLASDKDCKSKGGKVLE
jgi:hypothetical protein